MEGATECGMGRGMTSSIPSSLRRRMFRVFDNDGDAVITAEEISTTLGAMGLEAEMAELESLVGSFKALYESLLEEEEEEEENLSDAFKVFDEDGDGYISAKELQVVLRKLGFKEGKEIDCVHKMIGSVDTNRDGIVDFWEFKHMMRNPKLLVSPS